MVLDGLKMHRVVVKSQWPGIFPGYHECGPWLLLSENGRKIEPKEVPNCLIPRLLVIFTRQLEICVSTLNARGKQIHSVSLFVPFFEKQIYKFLTIKFSQKKVAPTLIFVSLKVDVQKPLKVMSSTSC